MSLFLSVRDYSKREVIKYCYLRRNLFSEVREDIRKSNGVDKERIIFY